MAFQGFSFKADNSNYVNMSSFSSMMSLSYLPKFDFPNTKQKNMPNNHNIGSSKNHFMQSVDIMNFVPGFRAEQSSRLCDFSKTVNPANNIKKVDHYPQFSSMNIFSYLVGGFVGSKSQVGCTSMQGDRFQIWDLVWEKLLEIVGGEDFSAINTKSCQESVLSVTNKNNIEKMNEPVKQSYAEVVKTLPHNLIRSNKNLHIKNVKDNMIKTNRQKRKQSVIMDDNYKGKLDFGRCEKKMSLQQMNSFSSSRWSNSRRKHFRKGIEKNNKRDKREAARDGLEYFNQELNEDDSNCSKNVVMVSNALNYNKDNLSSHRNKKRSLKKAEISKPVMELINNGIDRVGLKHDYDLNSNNFCVFKSGKCSNEVAEFSAAVTSAESNGRHRLGSFCSVDSDDSFIIFDRSGSEDLIAQLCCDFDLQMSDNDGDSSTSSSLSDDCDDDEDDSFYFIQTNFSKPCDKNMSYWLSNCDNQSNVSLTRNKTKDDQINCFEEKDGKNKDYWKNMCSKFKSINTSVPYTVFYDCKTSPKSQDLENKPIKVLDETDVKARCRLTSECSVGSEDSFVVFDSVDGKSSSCSKLNNLVCKFEIDDYDSNSDYSSEDFDEINCAVLTSFAPGHNYDVNSWLEEVNSEWQKKFNETEKLVEKKSKKVHFPSDNKLIAVRKMVTWDYALRAARIGPWEQLARDTKRFQDRIHCIGEVLQSVLDSEHREKIWKERFSDLYSN